jgi:uroporphyrinogen-III synthase
VKVLILRPQPGADESAARARGMGLDPVVSPLFALRPLEWEPPDPAGFDAVLMTSASAARLAGDGMTPFLALPCFAVGERTAAAARGAGFDDVRAGSGDGGSLLEIAAGMGVHRAFHPCGREHRALARPGVEVFSIPVYAADAVDRLPPDAATAIAGEAIALLHSPRAAALFAELVGHLRPSIGIAAISRAASEAAGTGWGCCASAEAPTDQALLELAAKLCQTARL